MEIIKGIFWLIFASTTIKKLYQPKLLQYFPPK